MTGLWFKFKPLSMALVPHILFYQRLLSGVLITVIIAGLYFYANSYSTPFLDARLDSHYSDFHQGLIQKEKRSLAPLWLHQSYISSQSSVVYVNYWSYNCRVCLAELPILAQFQSEGLAGQYKVLLFNVDQGLDSIKAVKDYMIEKFPKVQSIYSHPSAFIEVGKVGVIPYHQIIDKNGYIAVEFIGKIDYHRKEQIRNWIQILLKESVI